MNVIFFCAVDYGNQIINLKEFQTDTAVKII